MSVYSRNFVNNLYPNVRRVRNDKLLVWVGKDVELFVPSLVILRSWEWDEFRDASSHWNFIGVVGIDWARSWFGDNWIKAWALIVKHDWSSNPRNSADMIILILFRQGVDENGQISVILGIERVGDGKRSFVATHFKLRYWVRSIPSHSPFVQTAFWEGAIVDFFTECFP